MITCKYNEFLLDKKFDNILFETFYISENGKWINDNTYEWDINKKTKIKKFLNDLPKNKLKKYFYRFLKSLKILPKNKRKKVLLSISVLFFSLAPMNFYLSEEGKIDNKYANMTDENFLYELNKELELIKKAKYKEIPKKAKFKIAQKFVKEIEKGYSSDKGDNGNYIKTPYGRRFVGSNYGISAPVLMDYINKLPTKQDMLDLEYNTAVEIYKSVYWDRQNLNILENQSLATLIYDGCVNQGITRMRRVLRKSFYKNNIPITTSDNPFSEKYLKLVNSVDSKKLFNDIKKERIIEYKNASSWKRHGRGWMNRINSIDYVE